MNPSVSRSLGPAAFVDPAGNATAASPPTASVRTKVRRFSHVSSDIVRASGDERVSNVFAGISDKCQYILRIAENGGTLRKRAMKQLTLALTLCGATVAASAGDVPPERLDNWHHWRGPLANGTAPHGDPPVTWDANKNVKWKAALPSQGSSTPIVWGDQVFVLTATKTD